MVDFTAFPTYPLYRTLRRVEPLQRGYDVYALQVALNAVMGSTLALDGILGEMTQDVIPRFQKAAKIDQDGLAGGLTQKKLALWIAARENAQKVPMTLIRGQIEHESSFRLGCYSPLRSDGSYDAGVVQRNTAHTPAAAGFQPVNSIIAYLGAVGGAYARYEGVEPLTRRWGLAAMSWNCPAFANYIAREEGASKVAPNTTARPSDAARVLAEAYAASVTAYME